VSEPEEASGVQTEAQPHSNAAFACLDFVNSRFSDHRTRDRWHDRLPSVTWQRWFLSRWNLEVDQESGALPASRLGEARAILRNLLEAWRRGDPYRSRELDALDGWLRTTTWQRRLAVAGPDLRLRFVPARRDWDWVVGELADSAAALMANGEPGRLKVCGNPSCTWLFYDESTNRSRRWCDAAICGNLVKVREFRARRRPGSNPQKRASNRPRPASG
jgi:predicted RNA-binding Zn ribbon-like protein